MQEIAGYVFTVVGPRNTFLFGRKTHVDESDGDYANFEHNGTQPYQTKNAAIKGARDFASKRADCKVGSLAKIKMKIAESREESQKLMKRVDLIAIQHLKEHDYNEDLFLVPGPIDGQVSAYPLPGCFLHDFRFKMKETTYNSVLHLACEIARQAECGGRISTFNLKLLEDKISA